jgi:hypothetical protein
MSLEMERLLLKIYEVGQREVGGGEGGRRGEGGEGGRRGGRRGGEESIKEKRRK